MADLTYETEMNQPMHRPGMERVVNRAPMPIMQTRDKSGNETQAARPKVAPGRTDPFSVKGDPAPKAPAQTPPQAAEDVSGTGGRQREASIMDEVDKAAGG